MFGCNPETPLVDEDVPCEPEQNVLSSDEKTSYKIHGKWCKWKTHRQLEQEVKSLKAELKEVKGENENLKTENEFLKCMSTEKFTYIKQIRQYKTCLGNANLQMERLSTHMAAVVEALKLFDCVPYKNIGIISTNSAPVSADQSLMDDKAELTLLLAVAEGHVEELKARTEHLISKSSVSKLPAAGDGELREDNVRLLAHGDAAHEDLLRCIRNMQADVLALKEERETLCQQLTDCNASLEEFKCKAEYYKQKLFNSTSTRRNPPEHPGDPAERLYECCATKLYYVDICKQL